jgi:hypothetical protein
LPRRHSWLSSRAEACAPLPPGYLPRDVENVPLHRAVRHHRAAFAAVVARRGQMWLLAVSVLTAEAAVPSSR